MKRFIWCCDRSTVIKTKCALGKAHFEDDIIKCTPFPWVFTFCVSGGHSLPTFFIYQYIAGLGGCQRSADVELFIRCCDRTSDGSVQAWILHNSWLSCDVRPYIEQDLWYCSINVSRGCGEDDSLRKDANLWKRSLPWWNRYWHSVCVNCKNAGKGTSATTGLEYDSVGSPGCRISAHRWRVSENRSLPCLNSYIFFSW